MREWGRGGHAGPWPAAPGVARTQRQKRIRPQDSLSFRLVPDDVRDQSRLLARLRAASKAGYACCPHWGRGIRLVSASGTGLVLARKAWAALEPDAYLLIRTLDACRPAIPSGRTSAQAEISPHSSSQA